MVRFAGFEGFLERWFLMSASHDRNLVGMSFPAYTQDRVLSAVTSEAVTWRLVDGVLGVVSIRSGFLIRTGVVPVVTSVRGTLGHVRR